MAEDIENASSEPFHKILSLSEVTIAYTKQFLHELFNRIEEYGPDKGNT